MANEHILYATSPALNDDTGEYGLIFTEKRRWYNVDNSRGYYAVGDTISLIEIITTEGSVEATGKPPIEKTGRQCILDITWIDYDDLLSIKVNKE